MEKLKSEYPTNKQIQETLEAYRKGGDALMELIRKRRAEVEAAESEPNEGTEKGGERSSHRRRNPSNPN